MNGACTQTLVILAKAVIEAHKHYVAPCCECKYVKYTEHSQRCTADPNKHSCCKCSACVIAREILGE